jgi:hypothetical protein
LSSGAQFLFWSSGNRHLFDVTIPTYLFFPIASVVPDLSCTRIIYNNIVCRTVSRPRPGKHVPRDSRYSCNNRGTVANVDFCSVRADRF